MLSTASAELLVRAARLHGGIFFDVALFNLYRNGHDYVSPHYDKDALGAPVGSFSFGTPRVFRIFRGHPKAPTLADRVADLRLTHGSYILMEPGFQEVYLHAVPKVTAASANSSGVADNRLNVTLRQHNRALCVTGTALLSVLPERTAPALLLTILQYLFWSPTTLVQSA